MVDDSSTAPMHLTSELAPDLGLVERFIRTKFAEGALALLLASVMALLTRMSKLNTELMRQIALGRRKRPPSARMHRLQLELPLWGAVPDNDAQPPKRKPRKKRGPRNPRPHGRAKLPEHLERVVYKHWVEQDKCICPHCSADTAHVKFVPSERLDIEPARFVVRQDRMEMRACQRCHCKKLGIDPRRYMSDTLRRLLAGEKELSVLCPRTTSRISPAWLSMPLTATQLSVSTARRSPSRMPM